METKTRRRLFVALGVIALVVATIVVTWPSASQNDIPIPFLQTEGGNVRGTLTDVGVVHGLTLKRITFITGEKTATMSQNIMYLVQTPDDPFIQTVPLDDALTVAGIHYVNYYGYKYTTPTASTEKANQNMLTVPERFPGPFFASQKAWDEDAVHGNGLANFTSLNGVNFLPTTSVAGHVSLMRNSLYVFVVNDQNSVLQILANQICGNGIMEAPEQCDDGNTNNLDACTNSCMFPVCGNHVLEMNEQCDDGNLTNGDGCSAACQITMCGNGMMEMGEQCDDGNTNNYDGCTTSCQTGPVSMCGNNIVEPGEQCDHGANNGMPSDDCSISCQISTPTPF